MATSYGRANFGLYTNGHLEMGTKYNFSSAGVRLYSGSISASVSCSAFSNGYCLVCNTNQYGSQFNSDEYVEVDGSSSYKFSVYLKTLTPNYLGHPGSGYFGFSVYDSDYNQISPSHLYRQGATVLTRDVNQGDSYIYIADTSSWYTGAFSSVWAEAIIFPSDHPVYGIPYQYSRIWYYYDSENITWTGTDFQLPIVNSNKTPTTIGSNVTGYNTTAGTPIGNSVAGAAHQYVHGQNIDIPYDWTLKTSNWITGFSGSAGDMVAFRWGTKYVRVLALLNYKYRLETSGDSAEFLMDNMLMLKRDPGVTKEYPNSVFSQTIT